MKKLLIAFLALTTILSLGNFVTAVSGIAMQQGEKQILLDGDMEDPQTYSSELLVDGDMEAVGVGDWIVYAGATLTKSTVDPHSGSQSLRIDTTGTGAFGGARQLTTSSAKKYKITGYGRSVDGTTKAGVGLSTGIYDLWDSTTSTDWQYFEADFIGNGGTLYFVTYDTGGIVEFDNISVKEITGGTDNWVTSGTATATKETDSPHSGSQWLKLTEYNTGYGRAAISWSAGKYYRIQGWARGDGTVTPIITDGGGTAIWSGTNYTSWQPFDFVYLASAAQIQFGSVFSSAGFVGFDDVFVTEYTGETLNAEKQLLADGDMEEIATYGAEILTDGGFENATIDDFSAGSVAVSLTTSTASPNSGSQALRITNVTGYGYAKYAGLTNSNTYRVSGWARGDGTFYPRITNDTGVEFWRGTNSTSWQYFDIGFSNATWLVLYTPLSGGGSGNWIEFDDLSVKQITAGTSNWVKLINGTFTKETDAHDGTQCLRLAYNGNSTPAVVQSVLTEGVTYRVTGKARGDGGTGIPSIRNGWGGSAVTLWTGEISNTWQDFDKVFVANSNSDLTLRMSNVGAGYIEYDDIILTEYTGTLQNGDKQILADGDMEDPQTYGAELLVDGDMEAVGVGDWIEQQCTVTKETTNPYSGSQVLRVTVDVASTVPLGFQSVATVGKTYRMTGKVRSDGNYPPILRADSTNLWTGTTSTDWQSFDAVHTFVNNVSGGISFAPVGAVGTEYVEADNVSFQEITGGTDDWTAANSALLTKDSTSPYSGSQNIRIKSTGSGTPYAYQAPGISAGKKYRITGKYRGDAKAYVTFGGAFVGAILNNTSEWQSFDFTGTASANIVGLFGYTLTSGEYVEFDDVFVTQID